MTTLQIDLEQENYLADFIYHLGIELKRNPKGVINIRIETFDKEDKEKGMPGIYWDEKHEELIV